VLRLSNTDQRRASILAVARPLHLIVESVFDTHRSRALEGEHGSARTRGAQEKDQRNDGGAETHAGANQLDSINRADSPETRFAEHADKAAKAEDRKNDENSQKSAAIAHKNPSVRKAIIADRYIESRRL
jgi:hypothetical protein